MRGKLYRTALLLAGVVVLLAGCTSPQDSTPTAAPLQHVVLTVEAHPSTVVAGSGTPVVIFVTLLRGSQPVADSTRVVLLNTIGTLRRGIVYTTGGVALDTLTSGSTTGSGWVIAYAEGERDSTEVTFVGSP